MSRKVIIPGEFKDCCRNFHQDVTGIHSTSEKMIECALSSMREEQKHVVRHFLE